MIRLNNPQYMHFLQQADALRRSGSLCDAIIAVKNHIFHAHRLVLACASRKLAQQLFRDVKDSPVQYTLEVISPHTFQQVLDFTYTQTLEVSVDDLSLLLKAAQVLEMQPLEEQCKKQLNALEHKCKEGSNKGGITENNKQPANDADLRKKETIEDTEEEEEGNDCIIMEKNPTSDCGDNPQSPAKKPRLSPIVTPYSRDSVITTSGTHFTSPWTFPANMWNSVGTLRQIAQNYSTLISAYPLQNPNQTSVAFPFPLPTHHAFPLIPSPFQRPVQNSFMSYSRLHPHYSQNIYTAPTEVGSIIRQSLLKRKKQKALTEATQAREPSYTDAAKTNTGKAKDCQHCAARLISDPVSQESASTKTGCMFCRRDVVQHDPESHQQDHKVDKPFQCKHCPKKFSLKHQLDTHHRVHTGEKPFECRLCGQRSRDYSAMIKHLRTHGGAAPYQCTVCLEFCNSLVAMQRHVKSHSVQDFPSDWSISSTYLYTSHI